MIVAYFGQNILSRKIIYPVGLQPPLRQDSNIHLTNWGYGWASRFKFTENAGVKFSAEHAYRLQEASEFFGDGIGTLANMALKPEESDNLNLGGYYSLPRGKHRFSVEAGVFYRNVKNLIFAIPDGRFTTYQNVGIARITGLEGELGYKYDKLLHFTINASYQKSINNRQINPLNGLKDITYGDRIPNQPWFISHANLSIGQNNLLGKDSRLQLNYAMHYIHWFYITWESLGSKASKNKIPTQLIHDISLAYSLKDGRYNVSLGCYNFTNTLAYDNFRLQKPGRSFAVKLRYFIK